MDPKRFDVISQRLAVIGDRRRVLGALGALGGLVAVALPAEEVDAKSCVQRGGTCLTKKPRVKDPKRRAKLSRRLCTRCCSGCSYKGRCICCPDGAKPKNGNAAYCCSEYINTTDGTCQTTCAPGCAKCCPPPTGSTTPHCATATQTCCSSALGGGACTTGNACCNTTADCPVSQACIAGCCLPIS